MSSFASAIYAGRVVHKRLSPKRHAFTYRVFALALDVDEIPELAGRLRLLGYNTRAMVGLHDSDHGRGDGQPVAKHIRATLRDADLEQAGHRVVLVCYPRLLGFVFNPLSVYFCYDDAAALSAIVYEVSNTFGERISYVIPVDDTGGARGVVRQACDKRMYVSPFTSRIGQYGFHLIPPEDDVVIGVSLRDESGPVLKTHFRGHRLPLTDRMLARMIARHPLMTVKVISGIHLEAARLWLKGVPLVGRHTSPAYSVAVTRPAQRGTAHA